MHIDDICINSLVPNVLKINIGNQGNQVNYWSGLTPPPINLPGYLDFQYWFFVYLGTSKLMQIWSMRTEAKMSYDYLIHRSTVGRSSSDSLYAVPQVNVVGRSSADRKALQLIKVIGEVCFNVIAPVGRQKLYLSADKHAKFLSADCRPIDCF